MATELTRRGFLGLSAAIASTAALAACAKPSPAPGGSPSATLTGAPSPTLSPLPSGPLTVWNASSQLNDAIKNVYAPARPDVELSLVELGMADLQERLLVSLATSTDLPGVVSISSRVADQYFATGAFLPLGGALEPFAGGFAESAYITYEGENYGYALNDGRMGMWVNAAYLDENGIDAAALVTWEEWAEAGRKLKADTGSTLFLQPTGNNAADFFASYLNSRGTGWWDESGKVGVDEDVAIETLDFMAGLVRDGSAYVGFWTDQAYWEIVRQRQVAGVQTNFAIGGRNLPTNVPEQEGQWRMAGWPRWRSSDAPGTGTYGSTFFGVLRGDNDEAAADFATYWLTEDGLPEIVKAFGTVPYAPVAETAEGQATLPFFGGQKVIEDLVSLPYPTANYYRWSKVQEITGFQIDQAVQGAISAEEAIRTAVAQLAELA